MMSYRRNLSLSIFSLLVSIVLLSCAGTKAATNETWTLVELLSKGERIDNVEESVEVRNCGFVEHKTTDCSAGTSNDLSFSIGGGVQFGEGVSGSVNTSVNSSLGINRSSGESLDLESPPSDMVYQYTISKEYLVVAGEALARSSYGNEADADYVFHASCSIHIITVEKQSCADASRPAGDTAVEVFADKGWQNSDLSIMAGDVVTIEYVSGEWTGGIGATSDYDGRGDLSNSYKCALVNKLSDCKEPMPYVFNGALIGRIGTEEFEIGNQLEFTAKSPGNLYLRMNDHDEGLYDNSGSLIIRIVIQR